MISISINRSCNSYYFMFHIRERLDNLRRESLLNIKFYKDLKLFTIIKNKVSINEVLIHKNSDIISELPREGLVYSLLCNQTNLHLETSNDNSNWKKTEYQITHFLNIFYYIALNMKNNHSFGSDSSHFWTQMDRS